MKKSIIWLTGLVVAVVVLAFISIHRAAPEHQQSGLEPIRIGVVASLTGIAAPWGESMKNGIDLAISQINAVGGVGGRPVQVIYEDDHTDSKAAISAYRKLVDVDHVSGIIGSVFDFTTQPLLPLAESDKIALITPPSFRIEGSFELGDHSFTGLVTFDDMLLHYAQIFDTENIHKLGIIHFTSSWGTEISKTFRSLMIESGKPAPVEEIYNHLGGNDYRTALTKLKAAGVDAVFFDTLGDDTVNLLKNAKLLGFYPKFLTYTGNLEAFNDQADKSLIEGIILVNWEVTSPAFNAMYQKAYAKPAEKSADKGFDALYIMADAISHTTQRSDVAAYIASHSFTTPNATVSFRPDHTVVSTPIEIDVVKNGVLVPWNK
ncbi:MAG TPA: ABC transporter substrate-binding protein [Candidatus Paceibacterota bacterium]